MAWKSVIELCNLHLLLFSGFLECRSLYIYSELRAAWSSPITRKVEKTCLISFLLHVVSEYSPRHEGIMVISRESTSSCRLEDLHEFWFLYVIARAMVTRQQYLCRQQIFKKKKKGSVWNSPYEGKFWEHQLRSLVDCLQRPPWAAIRSWKAPAHASLRMTNLQIHWMVPGHKLSEFYFLLFVGFVLRICRWLHVSSVGGPSEELKFDSCNFYVVWLFWFKKGQNNFATVFDVR